MQVTINNEQKVRIVLAPVTAQGAPAPVDGKPEWSVQSGDVELDVAEDGLSCFIISGNLGNSVVMVTADADLGPGIRTLQDSIEVTVTVAEAASLGLTSSPPVPKVEDTPPS
jgi:hypothetical protein